MHQIVLLSSGRDKWAKLYVPLIMLLGVLLWYARPVQAGNQQPDVISALAWSPDGKLLASGSQNGQVSLWDTSGQPVRQLPILQQGINRIRWSPNNHFLLSWSVDNRALLWAINGELLAVFQECIDERAIQWSPDGDFLAVSPASSPLQIWLTVAGNDVDSTQGTLLASLGLNVEGDDTNLRLAWSPDGSLLAAGHKYSNIVYIWDFKSTPYWGITRKGAEATGALKVTLQDPKESAEAFVQRLEWSPDSKTLAIGYLGWTLQLWPRDQSLKTLASYPPKISGQYDNVEFAWSPDGKFLAFGDRYSDKDDSVNVRIWSPAGQLVETFERKESLVMGLAWSPKQVLAVAYNATAALDLWTAGQKVRSVVPEFDGFVWGGMPAWSYDGAYLAMRYTTNSGYARIQVWTADGKPVIVLDDDTPDENQPFAWSPTSNVLALRGEAAKVRLVSLPSAK